MLSTKNQDALHFGHSFLFNRSGTNSSAFYTIKAMLTATIQFFTYDGRTIIGRKPYR